MILIIAPAYERTVTSVCKWLNFYDTPFIRITLDELMELFYSLNMDTEEIVFKNEKYTFKLSQIDAIWIRKVTFNFPEYIKWLEVHPYDAQEVGRFLFEETNILLNYLFQIFAAKKPCLGAFYSSGFNKLATLDMAKQCGFNIPQTKILTDFNFFTNGEYITKPISEIFSTYSGAFRHATFTSTLQTNFSENSASYLPSLLQQKIIKKHELRVFVIGNKIYAIAINVLDEGENTDWRNVENSINYFYSPFDLSLKIRRHIKKLMKIMKIDIGALDLIEDVNGRTYFIEINPDGAFEMIQETLSVNIHIEIAIHLMNKVNFKREKNAQKKSTREKNADYI